MFLTIEVPAEVPSDTHSSSPVPSSPTKNSFPLADTDSEILRELFAVSMSLIITGLEEATAA